jgi:hypothetical protein
LTDSVLSARIIAQTMSGGFADGERVPDPPPRKLGWAPGCQRQEKREEKMLKMQKRSH